MKNVNAIIKNAWGESPPPKVKTGFIPNLCDWEKKNYLTNPGSYYRQKASVGYIAMKGWLFTILRLPNCTFANQVFSYFPFPFSILNNQILAIYKLYNHLWNDIKVSYPVKAAMKKTAFIALFSGMILSAGAQNTNRITEEEPDIKVTKDTVWNMAIEKKAAPKVQFPQPGDKIDVLDPIVYSLCYTTAYDRLARKSVKVKTYRKEYAPYIHAGYDFGVKHWKEIVLKDYSSLWKQLKDIAESTGMERTCFRNGALMGAYSTNPYPELDYIDAAISDVLKQVRKHIASENEISRHYYTLSDKWFSFFNEEKERYYDIANHNRPYFLCQEHADDALILPEWIDTATASNDITQSEALASAIAKVKQATSWNYPSGKSLSDYVIVTDLVDHNGKIVATNRKQGSDFDNDLFEQEFVIENPAAWTPETPDLYTSISKIYEGDVLKDQYSTTFGIRTVEVRQGEGFFLNGKRVQFKGVCNHHDLGPLGGIANEAGIRRQIRMLKDMGCNAIRTSHNMPAPELIKACDEMGMMVMAESFDEWATAKVQNGYHTVFGEWAEKDIVNLE